MTLGAWSCLLVVLLAAGIVVREVVVARRAFRPVRIGPVIVVAAVVGGTAVVGLLASPPLLGVPRRTAAYGPAPAFDPRLLVPALGVGLLAGVLLARIRLAAFPARVGPAVRTRLRVLAAAGAVLVIVGSGLLAVR